MRRLLATLTWLWAALLQIQAQALPDDGPLTIRPMLQQLGEQLLRGKQGSIVAIDPANGDILCLATNSPEGSNVLLAIAKAYAPGSTFKTAQALAMFSEGEINEQTTVACDNGFIDGNIKVGCHKHTSPLALREALAYSCNTWFLETFASMINDEFMYESKEEAIDTWRDYMKSMGLGAPMGIDIPGEKGGLLANSNYLSRRYKDGWDGKTIMWAAMGQGDVTLTPLQLCNLAASIANRGYYYVPHIHKDFEKRPYYKRFQLQRHTKAIPQAYDIVIDGMRKAVQHGTAAAINTPAYKICGKTGTIENPERDHSAFIGFAPMEQPKIAIAVYVEHGGFGADMAAPMAALVIETYLKGKLSDAARKKSEKIANMRITP